MTGSTDATLTLSIINRIKWISLIFIFAGVPLIVNPTAYDYWYKPKIDSIYALIIIIFIAVFFEKIIFKKTFRFRKTCLFIPLCFYSFSILVSTFLSVSPELSLKGDFLRYESIFTLLSYVLMLFIFSNFVAREEEFYFLIKALLFSTFFISLYGIIQYAGFNPTEHFISSFRPSEHRVGSTIGNPNFLGKFLVLVLPFYIACFFKAKSWLEKIFMLTGFIFSFLALVFTFTRGSWIGFGVSMILLFFIMPVKKGVSQKYKKAVIVIVVMCFAVMSAGLYFADDSAENKESFFPKMKFKISSSFDLEKGMGTATRLFVWKKVVGLISEKPVFGYGPDTHVRVMRSFNLEYSRKFNNYVVIDRAHNNYLDISVGRGLFGLGAYLSIIVTFMVWLWKTLKREGETSRKIVYCCIFASFFGYLVNDLFIFSVVSVSPTFWSLMGLTFVLNRG